MAATHKYDDADYHYGDEVFEEKSLPLENGGTHIGFFLAWVLINRLESESLRAAAADAIEKVRARRMTGREFLFEYTDDKLVSEDLNHQANRFARAYYDRYLEDYQSAFGSQVDSIYEVQDTWANYEVIAAVIGRRYAENHANPISDKPWWKFW